MRRAQTTQVAFDLGAESGRAIAGRFDGIGLTLTETRRFANRPVRLPGGLYWDALGLYAELCASLAALDGTAQVRSIGIDSWGCDFGLVDRDGALVSNPLHHRDGRGGRMTATAFARVSAEEIYETTGIQFRLQHALPAARAGEVARARGGRDDAPDPRPARLLAHGRAPGRGHEREHDAAARRADWSLVERADREDGPPPVALPRADRGGHRDRRTPPARRRGGTGTCAGARRLGRLARHRLRRDRGALQAGRARGLHLERHVVARGRGARRARRLARGARGQPDQ